MKFLYQNAIMRSWFFLIIRPQFETDISKHCRSIIRQCFEMDWDRHLKTVSCWTACFQIAAISKHCSAWTDNVLRWLRKANTLRIIKSVALERAHLIDMTVFDLLLFQLALVPEGLCFCYRGFWCKPFERFAPKYLTCAFSTHVERFATSNVLLCVLV